MRRRLLFSLVLTVWLPPLAAFQEPAKKPVLIRVEEEEADREDAILTPDPEVARKHVEVGDFYFKRDNYRAAEQRYRDAVRYHPSWPEPYRKLVKALEKLGEFKEAARVCEEFLRHNPESGEAEEFLKLARRLKAKGNG